MGRYFSIFSLTQAVDVILCNLYSLCLTRGLHSSLPILSHIGSFWPYQSITRVSDTSSAQHSGPAHPPQALPRGDLILCHSELGIGLQALHPLCCLPRSPGALHRTAWRSAKSRPSSANHNGPPSCQEVAITFQSLDWGKR